MQQQALLRPDRAGGPTAEKLSRPAPVTTSAGAGPDAALHRMAVTVAASPVVAAQRTVSAALHNSPQVTAQRTLAQRMQLGSAQQRDPALHQAAPDTPPPVQRVIEFEYDEAGDPYDANRQMSAAEVMAELADNQGVPPSQILRTTLDEFDQVDAIFSDIPELLQVLTDRGVLVDAEASDDEEADASGITSFFHGTDLATAQLLVSGVKIDARGKGELGGGFYMTHDLHQAAHIADYYTGKEGRGPKWGVVQFDIPTAALQGPLSNRKVVTPEEFQAYYESVKAESNMKESPYDWTIGPIKDAKTPYVQHLIASGGLAVLNDKATTRALVLSGAVGIEKALYAKEVSGYDQYDDETLDMLLEMEPEQEEEYEDEEEDEVDYDYLDTRVTAAKSAGNKRLTANVLGELEEALESAPGDERIIAWIAELSG